MCTMPGSAEMGLSGTWRSGSRAVGLRGFRERGCEGFRSGTAEGVGSGTAGGSGKVARPVARDRNRRPCSNSARRPALRYAHETMLRGRRWLRTNCARSTISIPHAADLYANSSGIGALRCFEIRRYVVANRGSGSSSSSDGGSDRYRAGRGAGLGELAAMFRLRRHFRCWSVKRTRRCAQRVVVPQSYR